MGRKIGKKGYWIFFSILISIFVMSCSMAKKSFIGWKGLFKPKEGRSFFSMRPHPGNPDSHYLLACYYQERGRHKEAIVELEKVLSIDPSHVKAYNGMGVSYDLLRDFPKAIESYEKALRLNADLDYVQNNLGYSHLLNGNIDEALIHFQRAVALNEKENRFHNNLGLAYAEKRQLDLALIEFKKTGNEAKAHYNLAQICFKKRLLNEARKHYMVALQLDSTFTIAQAGLEAARTLSRILLPTSAELGKTELKDRVFPDEAILNRAEVEKSIEEPLVMEEARIEETERWKPSTEDREAEKPIIPQERVEVILPEINSKEEAVAPFGIAEARNEEQMSSDAGIPANPPISMKEWGIEISNGNGVNQMATKVGIYLKGKGFKVVRLTNADHFNYPETKIYYEKGFSGEAHKVAHQFAVMLQEMKELKKLDRAEIKVKVLIGKDMIRHDRYFASNTQILKN